MFETTLQAGSPYLGMISGIDHLPQEISVRTFEMLHDVPVENLECLHKTEFNVLPTREVAKQYYDDGRLIPEARLYLYTDGSYVPRTEKQPEASGAGVVLMDSDGKSELMTSARKVNPPCHSYHSEVHAMILGLQTLWPTSDFIPDV